MLVNMNEILKFAKDNNYAVPQFNINNLEWTRFILEACQEKNSAVILGVSETTIEYMGGYKNVRDIVINLIEYLDITVPVVLHLDHGKSYDSCKKAINSGFSSVMIDVSMLSLEDNIKETNKVIEYAKIRNVSVEGEFGYIGTSNSKELRPTLEQILKYVRETNLDALAPSIGNLHGVYNEEPNLDFSLLKSLKENIDIPLVLHGGSGLDDNNIKKLILNGINKININTDLQLAWTNSVREYLKENSISDPRKVIKSGEQSLKQTIYEKIELFRSGITN